MKVIELTEPSLNAFRKTTRHDPKPGKGEVLIRLRAASLNFIDVAVATGSTHGPDFPLVPVADGAGEVVAVGDEVIDLNVGDRVLIHAKPLWVSGAIDPATCDRVRGISLQGSLAELVSLRADGVVKAPTHLDHLGAATLPIAATTAWNALESANIRPGTTVLTLGTGGVSIFVLQLAKARGARVIITSSSQKRLERARSLGADETIDYVKFPQWETVVKKLTDGRGADLVVDTGGATTFGQSLSAVAYGGTVFMIGFLSGSKATIELIPAIVRAVRIRGNNTGSVADLRDAVRAIAASKLTPIVDRVFSIDETRAAYELLVKGGQHFGKVAIAVDFLKLSPRAPSSLQCARHYLVRYPRAMARMSARTPAAVTAPPAPAP